ncbi:MAG: hypothetical protein ACNS63_10830 [Candidatus Nitrospinota bacterium M3_3B_026]
MPIQSYTPNRNLRKTAPGSTDGWDAWNNENLDFLDEPSFMYRIAAAEDLAAGQIAVIKDDGTGAKKAYLAASGAYTFADPLGAAVETAAAGDPVRLCLAGRVQSGGWAFGPADKFVYLSASGTVTTTPTPSKLGCVLSSTAIYLDPAGSTGGAGQTNTVSGANGMTNTGNNVDAVIEPVYGTGPGAVCQGDDPRLHTQHTDFGTTYSYFEINYLGNSARLLTTNLTNMRDYTFPDATTKLMGESAAAAVTADHDYSAGTLRLPTIEGAPTGACDPGDIVFDTVNSNLYVGLGGTSWKLIA